MIKKLGWDVAKKRGREIIEKRRVLFLKFKELKQRFAELKLRYSEAEHADDCTHTHTVYYFNLKELERKDPPPPIID